jgi:CoA:oxalate CoA-transferase
MAGPLKGIRVIDLSWVLSGPFATMVLADLGADVIKVERPGTGDLARRNGPFIDGLSSYFMSINRGKRSITLDLSKPRGKEILLALVERADILVENFVPGTMKRLGLDYEVLKEHNPRLIYASISGFGQTGPYAQRPALDVIVQGMAGTLSITGEPDGPPVRVGTSIGDITASLFAVIGILAALQERQVSGRGQALDISMLDSQVAILENAIARYFATGQVPRRLGTRHPVTTPFQAFRTRDGYIVVAVMDDQWPLFCKAIGRVDLLEDERFKSGYSRTQHYHLLEPIFNEAMLKKTSQEWLEELSALGIPCGPVNSIDRVVEDPQVVHRGMIKEVPHKRLGRVKVVNSPIKLSRTPPEVERPAPDLGEHTEEVLKELLGMGDEELSALRAEGII